MATRTTSPPRLVVVDDVKRPVPFVELPKVKYHSVPSNKIRPFRRNVAGDANAVLKDWYDVRKFFTFKPKTLLDFGQTVTFAGKTSVKLDQRKTENGTLVPSPTFDKGSWARFTTAIDKVGLDLRVWADGRIKLGWDAGYIDAAKNVNVFGMVRTNHQAAFFRGALGLAYTLPANGYISGRVKVNEKKQVILDFKGLYRHDNWRVFENVSFNANTSEVARYNGIIDYLERDFDISVAHESLKKTLELGRIITSVVYRHDRNNSFAAQLRVKNQIGRFIFGFQSRVNDKVSVKAKIDNRAKLTTAARFKLANQCFLSAATQVRLAEGAKAFNTSKVLPLPLGFTLDWTF